MSVDARANVATAGGFAVRTLIIDSAGNDIGSTGNALDVYLTGGGDIQIGAVEIKDGDTDTRLDVETDSSKNAAFVQSESMALESKQDDIIAGVEAATDMEGRGKISVGTTAVEVAFTGTPTKSINIEADIDNTGVVYIGKSNVTNAGANAFQTLQAGESAQIDYDDADNAVYVVASIASQNYLSGALL